MLNERDLQRKSLQYRKALLRLIETVAPAYEAAELLAKDGIQCRVLGLHTVKPLDQAAVRKAATETGGVITVEEHSVSGGLGEACAGLLLQEGIHARFKIVGFPDDHTVTGSQEEIFRHYGIDSPGLATGRGNCWGSAKNTPHFPFFIPESIFKLNP